MMDVRARPDGRPPHAWFVLGFSVEIVREYVLGAIWGKTGEGAGAVSRLKPFLHVSLWDSLHGWAGSLGAGAKGVGVCCAHPSRRQAFWGSLRAPQPTVMGCGVAGRALAAAGAREAAVGSCRPPQGALMRPVPRGGRAGCLERQSPGAAVRPARRRLVPSPWRPGPLPAGP